MRLLDTTRDIETPEGVELHQPVAGLGARSLAWLIDAFVKLGLIIAVSIPLQMFARVGDALMLLILFATLWLYNIAFEVLYNGATPGKRTMNIRVVNVDGTPVGWTGSALRNLIRPVDVMPGTYLFGAISVILTRHFQRLGDLAAGTLVVHNLQEPSRIEQDPSAEVAQLRMVLSADEQEALVAFAERSGQFSAARAEELAALLEPVLGPVDAARLRAYGAFLAGFGEVA